MQQRPLGRAGLLVSRLALGTMTWGRDTDADDAAAQLKTYVDVGGNLIDTADVYGDGDAEEVLGGLLAGLVPRDDLLIATKAGLRPGMERRRDGSRGHLLRTLDTSLRRLGTDHVDLWQVHGYDAETPLDETLSALDFAVTSGRVRYVGVSNFSGWQTAQAATWQGAWPGRAPIVSTQVEYSLLERGIEREVIPACRGVRPRCAAVVAAGPGGADRQVPQWPAGGFARRLAAFRTVCRPVPGSALLSDRGVGADRGRGAGRLAGRGGAGLGTRPAGGGGAR